MPVRAGLHAPDTLETAVQIVPFPFLLIFNKKFIYFNYFIQTKPDEHAHTPDPRSIYTINNSPLYIF
jgi:hypothetical protein